MTDPFPSVEEELLRALLGDSIRVHTSLPDCDIDSLLEEERAIVEGAIEKRRREFATGRALARRALRELDFDDAPILRGEDRGPIWPEGSVGSITHTDRICAVAAARNTDVRSIGIDIEQRQRELTPRMLEMILTDDERARIGIYPDAEQHLLALLIFSAKEAVYKCQRPVSGVFLGFHDVETQIADDLRAFSVEFIPAAVEKTGFTKLDGGLAHTDEFVLATTVLRISGVD